MSGSPDLVRAFDEAVLTWPEARAKQVFGHRGYVRGKAMFAFQTQSGVGVKAVDEKERERLLHVAGAALFTYNAMPMKGWVVLPLSAPAELDPVVQEARLAYEAVG